MRADQFRAACEILYGGPPPATARALNVSVRNVHFWNAGTKDVPSGVAMTLLEALCDAWYSGTAQPHLDVLRAALNVKARGTEVA